MFSSLMNAAEHESMPPRAHSIKAQFCPHVTLVGFTPVHQELSQIQESSGLSPSHFSTCLSTIWMWE